MADDSMTKSVPSVPECLVEVENLVKQFGHRRSGTLVRAVNGVSFSVTRGAALGLVGESGSGKTTIGRCILGLIPPTSGRVQYGNVDLATVTGRRLRRFRRHMQMVFQNPYDSLNPRWRIRDILEEPLILSGDMAKPDRHVRIRNLLGRVRLDETFLERFPHQLSGGQQQRVGIARALATSPDLVVLDEPTSALDTVTRAEILDLLNSLRSELGLTYIFISHDLSAVRRVCDSIVVMYLGRIVEEARTLRLFESPRHPYSRSLLSSLLEPRIDGRRPRIRLRGDPPSSTDRTQGCPLHGRCPVAQPACARESQDLVDIEPDRRVACMRVSRGEPIDWQGAFDRTQ